MVAQADRAASREVTGGIHESRRRRDEREQRDGPPGDWRDALNRAMEAHGQDPEAVSAAAEEVDLDAPDPQDSAAAPQVPQPAPAAAEQTELPDPDRNAIGQFSDPAESGAPATQLSAAISVYPRSGTQRRAVLDVIGGRGAHGATDEEVEEILQMRHQSASSRRYELMNDGWVMDSGRTRRTSSGRDAAVWVLSEQGAAQWEPRRGSTWEPGV